MKSGVTACTLAFFFLCPAAVLYWSPAIAFAYREGAPAGFSGSPSSGGPGGTCIACHSAGFGTTTVQILGAPTQYVLNRTYPLSVRVANSSEAGAGFEISAENAAGAAIGTMILTGDTRTRFAGVDPRYVTHTTNGVTDSVSTWAANGQSYTYNLRWRAPGADLGTVTFYAAGNAINNNTSPSGDRVAAVNLSATAVACTKADVNNDGVADSRDIRGFIDAMLNPSAATAVQYCAADMDSDGSITDADLGLFVAQLLGP